MTLHDLAARSAPVTAKRELMHVICECDWDVSMCGADVSSAHHCPDDMSCGCEPCVVCDDLIDTPCRKCGR